jgi:predicted nucleotidyltransferase
MTELNDRLKAISRRLKEQYHAQQVILFGSRARGTSNAESDVDLLIVAPTTERFFDRMATVRRLTRDLCHKLAIEPIVLTEDETRERLHRGDQFVRQITEEGISL